MSILCDREIKELALTKGMITPFSDGSDGISSGVSSYGYDAKLAGRLYIFSRDDANQDIVLDPKKFDKRSFQEYQSDEHFIIPPYGFALGATVEYFKIPRDILAACMGKSSYARCGLDVLVTPLEPGWEGNVTLEFSNMTPYPVRIHVNEGICQFIFFRAKEQCMTSYDEKKGKYMYQRDIVLPKHNREQFLRLQGAAIELTVLYARSGAYARPNVSQRGSAHIM